MMLYMVVGLLGVCLGVPKGSREPKDMLDGFKMKVNDCPSFPLNSLINDAKFAMECKDKLKPDFSNITSFEVRYSTHVRATFFVL